MNGLRSDWLESVTAVSPGDANAASITIAAKVGARIALGFVSIAADIDKDTTLQVDGDNFGVSNLSKGSLRVLNFNYGFRGTRGATLVIACIAVGANPYLTVTYTYV